MLIQRSGGWHDQNKPELCELKEVNAVRYLNMMTETGAGINPVTAVLLVGMKPVLLWNEQVLNDLLAPNNEN